MGNKKTLLITFILVTVIFIASSVVIGVQGKKRKDFLASRRESINISQNIADLHAKTLSSLSAMSDSNSVSSVPDEPVELIIP